MKLRATLSADTHLPTHYIGSSAVPVEPQAVSRIDAALRQFAGRNRVTSTEVVDLLVDLRYQLMVDAALADLCDPTPTG